MKMIVAVALACVALAAAAPAEVPKTLSYENVHNTDGSFVNKFETENGIVRQEEGTLKEALDEENKPHTVVVVKGSYSYPRDDGGVEEIFYTADENGFRAEGQSIPQAPPQGDKLSYSSLCEESP